MLGEYDEDDYAVNGTLAPPSNMGETLAPASSLGADPYDFAFHGQDGGSSDPYASMYHRG